MNLALWAAIGVGAGSLLGSMWGDVPIGIAIGMAVAVLVGGGIDAIRNRRKD